MTREDIIAMAYDLFRLFEKPLLITRHSVADDDPECCDHDGVLRDTTVRTLSISQIGPAGYSPVPNFTPQAMAYFLPRLIELAVTNVTDCDGDPYVIRFINSMLDGPENPQFELLKAAQKEVVFEALRYAQAEYSDIIEAECWADDLEVALSKWRASRA